MERRMEIEGCRRRRSAAHGHTRFRSSREDTMKLLSVCVTVGAISFVKCELRYDSASTSRGLHRNHIYEGERDVRKRDHEPEAAFGGSPDTDAKPEVDVEESNERKKDFSRVFDQIKNIYSRCKTKVNKRLKNLIEGKVKSRLSELKTYVLSVYRCVRVFGFRALDEALREDFIPVTDYASFVRDGANVTEDLPFGGKASVPLGEYAARVLGRDWTALVGDRFENLLRTHSLKFRLDKSLASRGRGRRRDHRMFAMMVMGFMIMASILIPMGFQFLTVLGGKSLLLAKMALIMSAINGLKKIATSNVGYGFYHTGSDGHHHDHLHHGFHEKHYHANPPNYNGLQGFN